MYDADGHILRLFLIHNGSIDAATQQTYGNKFGFIQTNDGQINYDCIDEAIRTVYLYVLQVNCLSTTALDIMVIACNSGCTACLDADKDVLI